MTTSQHGSNKLVVYAALAGNLAVAVVKFIAAALTGSSAMLSEGVHSLVDTGNEVLLLYGMKQASQPPDESHPFGYGREVYFWSFIVALLVFALGAGVSLYEGVHHLRNPEPMTRPMVNYIVLLAAMVFEGSSWWVAWREFKRARGAVDTLQAVRDSKDPTTFVVLFEDSAAMVGLAIALVGVAISHLMGIPEADGVASILIGLVLATTAYFLAVETKGLLMGEPALPRVRRAIAEAAKAEPGIRSINAVITSQQGPHAVVAAVSAEFEDRMTAVEIEACIEHIEAALKVSAPDVIALFVKPQTPAAWAERVRRRGWVAANGRAPFRDDVTDRAASAPPVAPPPQG